MILTTRLKPFARLMSKTELDVEMTLDSAGFGLKYLIRGAGPDLTWPEEVSDPGRRDELWKTTCFEMFVGSSVEKEYFEINLSPSGHWNLYHFDDYRTTPWAHEPAQVSIRSKEGQWLEAEIACDAITALLTSNGKIGVTAVLDWGPQKIEYWAMLHSGGQPDFHRRSDWLWSV